jgi:hypothetical protein
LFDEAFGIGDRLDPPRLLTAPALVAEFVDGG